MRQSLAVAMTAGLGLVAVAVAGLSMTIVDGAAAVPRVRTQQDAARFTADRIFLNAAQSREARASFGTDTEVRSILNIAKPLSYGEFVWNEEKIGAGKTWMRVDLGSQIISIFRGADEIGTAVMLYGAGSHETPTGVFPIQWKRKDHRSATYDGAPMPYTLRLTDDGVAIHGSDVKWGAATHGCIGVPLPFAERLFDSVQRGDKVVIVRTAMRKSVSSIG